MASTCTVHSGVTACEQAGSGGCQCYGSKIIRQARARALHSRRLPAESQHHHALPAARSINSSSELLTFVTSR